ncbi:hypothetical protein [Halosegnis longus]|uniref:Uncharacterized protein n=1 Tax=Halosegnis longus TaxID=2216012 RepID=A0AAJ4UUY8_9EURY|nr:hypothetical protein Nmn1133_01395 [Salella cibi]
MGFFDGIANTAGNVYGGVAGVADHLAGSTDEAIGRQFDDEEGGGIADGTVDTVAGIGDFLAGPLDESVGRQFDDTPGGGFADAIRSFARGVQPAATETGDFLLGSADDAAMRWAGNLKLVALAGVGLVAAVALNDNGGSSA